MYYILCMNHSSRTCVSTALVAVPSSRDSCCSSWSSGTESSEEADDIRLALEHLDHDEVQVARDEPRSSDDESVEAELEEEEQEEEEDEDEAATGHEAANEEGRIRYLHKHKQNGFYSCRICADGLMFSTRYTRDLATALDFVVALMGNFASQDSDILSAEVLRRIAEICGDCHFPM